MKKDAVLLYDGCCLYETVVLNYFLSFSGCDTVFCSLNGKTVKTMEGYSVHTDIPVSELALPDVRSFIVPGGQVAHIDCDTVMNTLRTLNQSGTLIAAICAGVDILDKAGILWGIPSTHSTDGDCVRAGNIITARANAYVDFAIETAKALKLFRDEADLQETIAFWKHGQRLQ